MLKWYQLQEDMGSWYSRERAQLRQKHCVYKGIFYGGGTEERSGYGRAWQCSKCMAYSVHLSSLHAVMFWKLESREITHTSKVTHLLSDGALI